MLENRKENWEFLRTQVHALFDSFVALPSGSVNQQDVSVIEIYEKDPVSFEELEMQPRIVVGQVEQSTACAVVNSKEKDKAVDSKLQSVGGVDGVAGSGGQASLPGPSAGCVTWDSRASFPGLRLLTYKTESRRPAVWTRSFFSQT